MTYSENGDAITIAMSRLEYERLLLLSGVAAGMASRDSDRKMFWEWIDFVNRLNTGNPRFIPYEIPEQFKPKAPDGGKV